MNAVAEVYQEYFFAKIACSFNIHFVKPLMIDCDIELGVDKSSLFFEIIFEYGGTSLGAMKPASVDEVYNLMRQSANALSLLHNIGITHFDIKPDNMVYNKDNDLLKIIDMGSSFGANTVSGVYRQTVKLLDKMRSYTPEFAPPEALKLEDGKGDNSEFIIGSMDVYSWGMCFYSLLFNKKYDELKFENDNTKLGTEADYQKFIKPLKNKLEKIKVDTLDDQKKLNIISEGLLESLSFKPEQRPSMPALAARMKEFEKAERIDIDYAKAELEHAQKLLKMLRADCTPIASSNLPRPNVIAGEVVEQSNIDPIVIPEEFKKTFEEIRSVMCNTCKDNVKAILQCGHKICKRCLMKYVLAKFLSKKNYNYEAMCKTCNRICKLSALFIGRNFKWTTFGMKVENTIDPDCN